MIVVCHSKNNFRDNCPNPVRVPESPHGQQFAKDMENPMAAVQVFAPIDMPLPPRPAPSSNTLRAVSPRHHAIADDEASMSGPMPTPINKLPDACEFAVRISSGVLEVLDGVRPLTQLDKCFAPPVRHALSRRATVLLPNQLVETRRYIVQSVLVCHPQPHVAEVALVVTGGERPQSLAMRLEGRDGRWRVCELEMA